MGQRESGVDDGDGVGVVGSFLKVIFGLWFIVSGFQI